MATERKGSVKPGGGEIGFIVAGLPLPAGQASALAPGRVRGAVRLGATRGGAAPQRLLARPGQDVVVLQIAQGPTLYLHPEDARDLLRAQTPTPAGPGDLTLPAELAWPQLEAGIPGAAARGGATRGLLGRVMVSAIEVVTGVGRDQAAALSAAAIARAVDAQVSPGLYALSPTRAPARLKDSSARVDRAPARTGNPPLLVLVHGTFVETGSTFGALWQHHPQSVRELFSHYGADGVYAFEHRTLGDSPVANALALAQSLPHGARLHLLTHSRGGLVAEVLVRACAEVGRTPDDPFTAPGHAAHSRDLKALRALVAERGIAVDRVVRVACPARGTLLASNRLTAYVSVLKWALELAQVPVQPELVDFLMLVAQYRTDPAAIPGLAAMQPDSPVLQWLTGPAAAVPGDLRVLAGDLQGDPLTSWLKTLLSDAFYWTDNDLVVQTRSMYGGVPRQGGASFLLDQGGTVSHFSYFANARTAGAAVRALTEASPAGFMPIGPLSWAGDEADGTRAPRRSAADPAQRPAVFVLPGILGSHLKVDGQRVWLGWRFFNHLDALDVRQPSGAVTPDGPIAAVYGRLMDHLAQTHEVHEFGYDWRLPLEDEAHRLADAVAEALAVRQGSQQPVRLLAHSMGGLLARTLQLERPQVWQQLMARPGARLLMLGTPNGGSWAPMQVLSGDDSFGNALTAVGALFDGARARDLMAQMPGFIQLQAALLDGTSGLAAQPTWQALADDDARLAARHSLWHSDPRQRAAGRWGVPAQAVLDRAVALRRRLDEQLPALAADLPRLLLVVGAAGFTPAGVRTGDEGIEYLDAAEHGDGRVTLTSACLAGVRTWRVDASHGELPSRTQAFDAYLQLLESGHTTLLEPVTVGVRDGRGPVVPAPGPLRAARPSRQARAGGVPPGDVSAMFGASPSNPASDPTPGDVASAPALQVRVVNGNLKFVNQPLLLGHYRALALTGTEKVVDTLLGGKMARSLAAGLYPSATGTHQVFINRQGRADDPFALPRPAAVVVAGLGEEGKLRSQALTGTIRQATLAYAQRVADLADTSPGFELAATLIGSGGSGITPAEAARAVASGVKQANALLARHGGPRVSHLQLIELYLDRATEAHQALRMLSSAQPGDYELAPQIQPGTGPLRRPAGFGYRGAQYDFISIAQHLDAEQQPVIDFTLDSQRARNEVRAQGTQSRLVNELIRAGADDLNRDQRIGRSLFNLLVPVELQPFLAGSSSVVLQLDTASAAIPWEMLDTSGEQDAALGDRRPWAVRTRMVRRLRTHEFRDEPVMARAEDSVLVIGEPQADPSQYPPLPAAENEARAVAAVLGVEPLIHADALAIINAIMERPYRIVHVAGHGKLPDPADPLTGVVLANDTVLGPREIKSMRTVPELAFVNCCHLGRVDPGSALPPSPLGTSQPLFAASVAEQLIQIGVRCVVAAGWAVEDDAAQVFATRFYEALLGGERFLDAVGRAREAAWQASPEGNTWAAYQCYGDPDWVYTARRAPKVANAQQRLADHAIVSSLGLATELETLAVTARFDGAGGRLAELHAEVQQIEAGFEALWGHQGAVAEAFGIAFEATGDRDAAIRWFEAAVAAEDGSASMKAGEQLAGLLARRGETQGDGAQIRRAIAMLDALVAQRPSAERHSLLGSAWKRLAMVAAADVPAEDALQAMARHYGLAEQLAQRDSADTLFQPMMKRMSAELALHGGRPDWPGFAAGDLALVRQSLAAKSLREPDFWCVLSAIELEIYEAVAAQRFAVAWPAVHARLEEAKVRAPDVAQWGSVRARGRFVLGRCAGRLQAGEERAAVGALLDVLDRCGVKAA